MVWDGSMSRMAADLDMTLSALSNIISGRRTAGRETLAAIVNFGDVDARWLLTGEGSIFEADKMLPVSAILLPGAIDAHKELLTGDRWPATKMQFSRSRYWLRLNEEQQLQAALPFSKRPGPLLLLMETDADYWRLRPQAVVGHHCVITAPDEKLYLCEARELWSACDDEPEYLFSDPRPVVLRQHRRMRFAPPPQDGKKQAPKKQAPKNRPADESVRHASPGTLPTITCAPIAVDLDQLRPGLLSDPLL